MTNNDFMVTIEETSLLNLSNRDKVMLKDTADASSFDELLPDDTMEPVIVAVKDYAILNVHNENSDNKDYKKYLIIDTEGAKYVTGSDTFFRSFLDIYNEMAGEPFSIKVYKKPSTNFKGKFFLSCSIL